MNQPNKISGNSIASAVAGFSIAGIAALVTFGLAIAILSKLSWAAVFVFLPFLGIAFLAWGAIVSIANRRNGAMWGGTIIFTVFAMVSLAFYVKSIKSEQVAKRASARQADIELGESLATSRKIKNPTGPIDLLAVYSERCGGNICADALLYGMAKEVVTIYQFQSKAWLTYYRLRPIEMCPTDNDTLAAVVYPLQKLGIFNACLRRERKVHADPHGEIKDAVLLSFHDGMGRKNASLFPSRHVNGAVARKMKDGRITEEIARWEYFKPTSVKRNFGKRFDRIEFLEALTGTRADKDKVFVTRSFSDAVSHIKKKIGFIKVEYGAVSFYLQKLLKDIREKTGGPVIVTKATNDELQVIIDDLCNSGAAPIPRCTKWLGSLRDASSMEIRP